jgi:acyl-CoA synthetase (NDP forming)
MEDAMTRSESLSFLFRPRSVALVGASATPGKLGARIVGNLLDNGFSGKVFPVNPGTEKIGGLRCYPSVEALPEPVDVAYVLVPADAAVEATWSLGRAGAKAVIIAAAGFAETNTGRGRIRQASLTDAAATTGIRVVGPNCNGIYNATDSVSIGFNTAHGMAHPAGGMSIVSHSGALFSTIMLRARKLGVGLSKFVSVGNEADLDVLDFMEYLVHDEPTKCICLIVDSLPDGARFARLAGMARERGQRIVALKLGTSLAGATAAVAHSSRLAGRAEAYAALFRHCGAGTVDTIEQLVGAAALVDQVVPVPPRPRLGVVTRSGGASTIIADTAGRRGIPVPCLSAATMARLSQVAPGMPIVHPIDLGAAGGKLDFPTALGLLRGDENVDVVVHYYHPMPTDEERTARAQEMADSRKVCGKPHILLAPGGLTDDETGLYRQAGITVYSDTDVCMAALAAAGAARPPVVRQRPHRRRESPLPPASGPLDEITSIRLLRAASIPMAHFLVAETSGAAVAAGRELGWPVVLKGTIPGVAHKSDHGLVATGIDGPARCRAEAMKLLAAGAAQIIIQPHLHGDLEALIGLISEPKIGQFAVFGLGGVHTEALADVTMVPADAGNEEIAEALAATRLGAVLRSPRWRSPETFPRLVDIIGRLADFGRVAGPRLAAVDVNPLIISGDDIIGVDGLIVLTGKPRQGEQDLR